MGHEREQRAVTTDRPARDAGLQPRQRVAGAVGTVDVLPAGRDPVRWSPAATRIRARSDTASAPDPLIRRVTVTDEETGEELRPITSQDLLDGLPPQVRQAVETLAPDTIAQLQALPMRAQLWLAGLTVPQQLAIVAALRAGMGRLALPGPEDDADGGSRALVPVGGEPAAGGGADAFGGMDIPEELLDILLGRNRGADPFGGRGGFDPAAAWMQSRSRIQPMGLGPREPLMLMGPMAMDLPPMLPVFEPDLPDIPLVQDVGLSDIERQVATMVQSVPGLSIGAATDVLAANPASSMRNLVRIAQLAQVRPDWKPLLAARPPVASVVNVAALAEALPACTAPDVAALAALLDRRTVADVVAIATAGAHRPATELVALARAMLASPVADVAAFAQVPATCPIERLVQVCRLAGGAVPAAPLAYVLSCAPAASGQTLELVAALPGIGALLAARVKSIALLIDGEPDLFTTAVVAQNALLTPHVNHLSSRVLTIVRALPGCTLAHLTTVLTWGGWAGWADLHAVVTHAKMGTVTRLVAWLTNVRVNAALAPTFGGFLLNVLNSPKIEDAPQVSYLIQYYNLSQILSWLGQPWATRSGQHKVPVNGRLPMGSIPGTGGTAGQRYTVDQASHAWPGHVYHLSMSFGSEGTVQHPVARYTGFHVSWRIAGDPDRPGDPRQWYAVAGGQVTVGNATGGASAPMSAEALRLMRSMLTRVNCYM